MIETMAAPLAWRQCLETVKRKLSESVFNDWIKPLSVAEQNDFQLSLLVPSHLDMDLLKRSYAGLIEHSYQEANGQEIRLQFKKAPEPERQRHAAMGQGFGFLPAIDLNPSYTFEEFIVGSNSQFANSAAFAVAKDPGGTKFNPLLIYGGVGLGKTHLLQAIGNYAISVNSRTRVRYVTSEAFYREFVESIQHNRITELSNFYRNEVDILLMDDVQFLSGKDRTQEEFFHIFNALHQSRKQIVLTSDSPPGDLRGLEDRLVSRFQWGLFVDIQSPDRETREAILRRKAKTHNLDISEEIIAYLAEHIDSNIRIMEGAIRQLLLQASIKHAEITMELASEVVARISVSRIDKRVSLDEIGNQVSDYFGIDKTKLSEKGRGTKEVALARQICMFLAKELTSASLKSIGINFGGRDHSTVIHAIKTVEKEMDSDGTFKKNMAILITRLQGQAK